MGLNLNYEPEVLVPDITLLPKAEWIRYRKMGIGGSDAAAACGVSPWKTARDLYEEKLENTQDKESEDNWVALEIGKRLEELVVQIFMKQTGLKPYAVRKMFRHPLYPFMLADVDYFVEIGGDVYVVECKTSFSFKMNDWENGNIPRHYELQGRHYMSVTNTKGVIFLCLYGNSEDTFLMRKVERDFTQEEELIEQETYFWNEFVLKRNPPAYRERMPLVLNSLKRRLKIREHEQIELSGELASNIIAYMELKRKKSETDAASKALDEQMKGLLIPVQEAMQGAEKGRIVVNGTAYQAGYAKRITTSIPKKGLEAMQLLYPDICQEFTKTASSYIFYVKEEKAG